MGSLLQCALQCWMKPSSSGSAKPITAHVHLLAVSPPSMEQHTTAFSSRAAAPLPAGQFSHTCRHHTTREWETEWYYMEIQARGSPVQVLGDAVGHLADI